MKKIVYIIILSIVVLVVLTGCTKDTSQISNNSLTDGNEVASELKSEPPFDIDKFYTDKKVRSMAKKLIGEKFVDLQYTDMEANVQGFYDKYKGKRVVVEFMGTYCDACVAIFSDLDIVRREREKDSIEFISIAVEQDLNEVKSFLKLNGYTGEVVVSKDGELIRGAYKSIYIPTFLFLDENGVIQLIHVGSFDKQMFDNLIYIAYRL